MFFAGDGWLCFFCFRYPPPFSGPYLERYVEIGRPGLVSGAHTGSSMRLKNLQNHVRGVRNQTLRIEKKHMQATGVKKVPLKFQCLKRRARRIRTPPLWGPGTTPNRRKINQKLVPKQYLTQ